ncbi:MAG: dicarboxylate/amino acid:cation symporter [Sphaerochaetaceae bacterium]|nr:dicarboxylate/amino acid:cation symporter [Sphaerochaetaceae bacterium]
MKEYSAVTNLFSQNIDKISEELTLFLKTIKTNPAEITTIRLNVEEVLLRFRDSFGENVPVSVQSKKILGQRTIVVSVEGKECNPFESDDELGIWMSSILSHLENKPSYYYSHKTNTVSFKVSRKKINPFILLLISIAFAVVAGFLGRFLPDNLRLQIADNILAPVCSTYINVLCFCGIPLIFLSVCLGVIGVGDIQAFSQIGIGMIKRYMFYLLIAGIVALGCSLPFFNLQFGHGNVTFDATNIFTIIFSWCPTNLLVPFIDCNAMQLIIMGVVFGMGILKLNNKGKYIYGVFNDLNSLMLMVSGGFTTLIPVFVFFTLVESILKSDVIVLLQAGKSLLITSSVQILFVMMLAVVVSIKSRVKIVLLLRKLSDLFLISFGTNSCSASIPEHYQLSSSKLGIPENTFSFGIPIGTSIFKPATAIRYLILTFFMAVEYNICVAPSWLIMAAFVCVFLSVASPAIPGGALLLCPMLFAQLGIPAEALGQMLATDVFFDAVCTALNQVSVQLVLADFAISRKTIKEDILKK